MSINFVHVATCTSQPVQVAICTSQPVQVATCTDFLYKLQHVCITYINTKITGTG